MADQRASKAVDYSCRVYRRLLLAYPKSHRQEYGAAILQLFRDQCRDAWAAQRAGGLITFWLRALADLLKTSVLEHLSTLNRSRIMPTLFRPTIKPLPAFFGICAAVCLPIFLASVVVTLIYPETYAGSTTILVSRPNSAPDPNWVRTEIQVISSSAVLEKVTKNLDLTDVWGKKYNNGQPLRVGDAVALLKSRLDFAPVTRRDGSGVVLADGVALRIRAYSDNPEEAANLANSVVESYRDFGSEQLRRSGTFLNQRRVTLLDHALPQSLAIRPNKPLNIVIGALLGLLIGAITAPFVLGFFAWLRKRRGAPPVPQNA